MEDGESRLKQFIKENNIKAEHMRFQESLHSVQQLLRVTGLPLELITKTMIFKGEKTVAAMIPAAFHVSVSRLSQTVGFDVELANAKQAYELTGYPIGGMPCFINALLVVDPKVFEKEFVYTGGGSEFSIVKIATAEILKLNPIVARITGKKSN